MTARRSVPGSRVAASAVITALVCLTSLAHATRETQGRDLRGAAADEFALQSGDARQDMGLIGVIDDADRGPVLIEVHGVYGASVDATVWRIGRAPVAAPVTARDLIGLTWRELRCAGRDACQPVSYRIVDATRDPINPAWHEADRRATWLFEVHHATVESPAADDWTNTCAGDRDGRAIGLLISGLWDHRGAWTSRGYTFACTGGVIAKCARRWGYAPWRHALARSGQRVNLRPLHLACVRAARADYCGDGAAHTKDGTAIDLFDAHGFNDRDPGAGFIAEAGFSPHGAVWLDRTRWPTHGRGAVPPLACSVPRRDDADGRAPGHAVIQVWSRPRAPTG